MTAESLGDPASSLGGTPAEGQALFLTVRSRLPSYLARVLAGRCGSPAAVRHLERRLGVDIVFILVIAGLYALSHGLAWALSRLGGEP